MILSILAATPIAGALLLAFLPRQSAPHHLAKIVALGVSLITLALSLVVLAKFDTEAGGYQMTSTHEWIGIFGAHYAVGVNGIGITLILLTTILAPIVILAAFGDRLPDPRNINAYFAWMLAVEGLAIGAFAATDAFLFYVLFEATLVPLYFLIGSFGGPNRSYAAVKFLIYNLVGGLLMLASIVGLYVISARQGDPSYLLSDLQDLDLSTNAERLLFLGFFAAFAIKAPLWPLHTWLPDAAKESTPGTAVLMVSVVDKIGTFGMIRWCLGLFPGASDWASPVVIVLAVISIVYGALLAIGQDDIRRLVAFTSVSHFGFIILGIFAFTTTSMAGSTLYMFNHGLSTAALFLVTGVMIARRGSARISDFGGVQKIAPILSGVLLIAGLSSLSLPGLAPFVSEFLVLSGTFTRSIPAAAVATLGIVLAALYILIMYQRTMTGPLQPGNEGVTDLEPREIAALTPAIMLIIGLGFFPQPLLNAINPAIDEVVSHIGKGDPSPKTTTQIDVSPSSTEEGGH
ncbi:MAG: NADH-quinone oxidoreductase subunit M [Aeromicrobium sp.]